ncbi:lactate racemase domain-containing protein [Chloroflexota bacterium]
MNDIEINKFNTIRLPQLAWYDDNDLELQFPPSWDVSVCYMKGYAAPSLSEEQIKQAFTKPIGTPRICDLANDKKEVVILFDDLSRPTKVYQLVPYILQELEEAGIADDRIRFIATLGNHAAMKRMDFTKKLGEDVMARFAVYNHNAYENCTYVGDTSRGTRVEINSEVMACELKIAIGSIVPHGEAGFGGGAKAIIPGVSSINTTWSNHVVLGHPIDQPPHPTTGIGKVDSNIVRLDMEEAARMAGLDIIVNVVPNGKRDPVGLFVGDVVAAHREGVKLAREVCAAKPAKDVDIIVTNNYSKSDETAIRGFSTGDWFKIDGGSLVTIANTPDGEITHYLGGRFGKTVAGRGWRKPDSLPPRVNEFIIFAPYPDRRFGDQAAPPESIIWARTWLEVLEKLIEVHQGKARVAIVPDVGMQFFP